MRAGLIAAAQRVEHYEMAGYGCARTYAVVGDRHGAQLLQTTLTEESDIDKKLTKLAKSVINCDQEYRHPTTAGEALGVADNLLKRGKRFWTDENDAKGFGNDPEAFSRASKLLGTTTKLFK